jgi:bacterioferritin
VTDKTILQKLNDILKSKLTGINQYFLHARMLKHKGVMELADFEYKSSIDAMKHSDMLVEYILSMGGEPRLQELDKLRIGEGKEDMLKNDLVLAEATLTQLKSTIDLCRVCEDDSTAAFLGRIMETQKEHVESLRKQLNESTQNVKECA